MISMNPTPKLNPMTLDAASKLEWIAEQCIWHDLESRNHGKEWQISLSVHDGEEPVSWATHGETLAEVVEEGVLFVLAAKGEF